jgi:LmbE family N-acetylglucosaminyl deacetylase
VTIGITGIGPVMTGEGRIRPSDAFLAALADDSRPPIRQRVFLVVAHPDDEALACGALLPRLADCTIVHVTDGAPRGGEDAARHGFASPADYAAARARELAKALDIAGVAPDRRIGLGIADQGVAQDLAGIARRLVPMLAGAEIVLTHAYEGGHPDHDGTAFAVAAAVALAPQPAIVEMPFYRAARDGEAWIRQSFASGGPQPTRLRLTEAERALKARMLAAHRTQAGTLDGFGVADEAFRRAPAHDFSRPPGIVLYDRYRWGITSSRFCDLAQNARRELGLAP